MEETKKESSLRERAESISEAQLRKIAKGRNYFCDVPDEIGSLYFCHSTVPINANKRNQLKWKIIGVIVLLAIIGGLWVPGIMSNEKYLYWGIGLTVLYAIIIISIRSSIGKYRNYFAGSDGFVIISFKSGSTEIKETERILFKDESDLTTDEMDCYHDRKYQETLYRYRFFSEKTKTTDFHFSGRYHKGFSDYKRNFFTTVRTAWYEYLHANKKEMQSVAFNKLETGFNNQIKVFECPCIVFFDTYVRVSGIEYPYSDIQNFTFKEETTNHFSFVIETALKAGDKKAPKSKGVHLSEIGNADDFVRYVVELGDRLGISVFQEGMSRGKRALENFFENLN